MPAYADLHPSRTVAFTGMACGLVLAFAALAAVMPRSVLLGLICTALASALTVFCGYHFFGTFGGSRGSFGARPR